MREMRHIGILAYGSLIDCPGEEIRAGTARHEKGVETPFKVEFARCSRKRDGAPTLVPVEDGGARVKAVVFILKDHISEAEAKNMLWRRETHRHQGTYSPPAKPSASTVCIERLENFRSLGVVLYTKIAPNINHLTPQGLAELAIKSTRGEGGTQRRDGISYLIDAKRHGVMTPLTAEYEEEILRQTGTKTLEEAWRTVRPPIA
ncbi:MAG: hypothetical protein ACE5JU_17975 [Candidatus Binatia bacterium]